MNNSGGSYGGGSVGGSGGGSGSSRTVWAATTSVSSSGKRIHMEMKQLDANPPPLCSAGPISDNIYHWVATLFGPTGTPYEGGIYFLDIIFPHDYPFKPPQVMFKTRVYHCNVDSRGHLNLPLLSHAWSPAFTVSSILLALRSMFSSPDPCISLFSLFTISSYSIHLPSLSITWKTNHSNVLLPTPLLNFLHLQIMLLYLVLHTYIWLTGLNTTNLLLNGPIALPSEVRLWKWF